MPPIQKKHRLVIPSRWDIPETEKLLELEKRIGSKTARISAFFASINDQPIGHGRSRAVVPYETITLRHATGFVESVRTLNKKFTFLVNGPFEGEPKGEVLDYLRWIVSELKPTGVMVRSPELMLWFLNNSSLEVHVSSILNIRSREDLKGLFDLLRSARRGIRGVVLGQDTSRLFENFRTLSEFSVSENPFPGDINYELLVNETCLFGCEKRATHHNAQIGQSLWPDPFQHACNQEKIIHPDQLLRSGGLIPPQLLETYRRYGVGTFKIAGRELPFSVIRRATEAYLTGSFSGNMIALTAMTPPQISGIDGRGASDYFYVDTEELARLMVTLLQTKVEEREAVIRRRAIKMYREDLLHVGNNNYNVVDGRLTLVQ